MLCGLLSVTFDQGSERSFVLELCNGHNSEWLEILYLHNGEVEQYHPQVILTILCVLTVEAASYMTCMYDCYTHDKSMTKILSMETVKKRHRKSAISLVCELYCYIIECVALLALLACQFAFDGTNAQNYLVFVWQFEFAIQATVQACSHEETRNTYAEMLNKLAWIWRSVTTRVAGIFQAAKSPEDQQGHQDQYDEEEVLRMK